MSVSKSQLSKNILQMKFMKKTLVELEKNEEESQRIDEEHWVLDIPEKNEKESRYIEDPSYQNFHDLLFGRMSFKGFNPDVEDLMKRMNAEKEELASEARERELGVSDEEMASRYQSLVGTIANKFSKKKDRSDGMQSKKRLLSNTSDDTPTPAKNAKKRTKTFRKPKED